MISEKSPPYPFKRMEVDYLGKVMYVLTSGVGLLGVACGLGGSGGMGCDPGGSFAGSGGEGPAD